MSNSTIQFDVHAGVAVLRLNRPDTLNSFNSDMHVEVRDALSSAASDAAVRAVLLTGNGRAFCAGQDLNDRNVVEMGEAPDVGESVERHYNPLIRLIATMEKPVICAVNGVAAGAGANIALACDIVLASRSASFIESFCKLGLVPDSGGTWILPRLLGMARARGVALLGPRISAEQAQAWGLIWQVVDDSSLWKQALELAQQMAGQPTRGLALTKKALLLSTANTLDQQLDLERDLMRAAGRTNDYREGVSAFLEKREPTFTGS